MYKSCRYRHVLRFLSDKRAISDVISATMMAGTVITLSFVVFAWSQSVSSSYNNQYNQTVTTEIDKLKEKIVFEYVYYASAPKNVSVYLLNCGTIDTIKIKTVYIIDSSNTVLETFSSPSLRYLSTWNPIPDQWLDRGKERRIVLHLSTGLIDNAYYSVRIVTERGATFDSSFVV